jgi:tetratricopeptide (TPR) repeat protein
LAAAWVAFFGALWFAVNPVASYGVAYLVQRSILMATLFALLTWWCLLEGLRQKRGGWLVASALAYVLAAHSKEHALLVPLVAVALVVLQGRPDRATLKKLVPTFLAYTLIAAEVYLRVRSGGILGRAYEPNAEDMLASLGVAADGAYPLSVLTQAYLYFKYLLLWLVPNPGWMSVALEEDFAAHYLSWPQAIGFLLVPAYLVLAVRMLLKGGQAGLFGFGLLSPGLLFLIEFSTVRIQEIFVLYRSYLWMPCLMAALPYALQRIPGRIAAGGLIAVSLALAAVTVERLRVFAEPVLLWEDAYEKAKATKNRKSLGRIFYHRGRAYLHARRFDEAIQALTIGMALRPGITDFYFLRGAALFETGQYQSALEDFDRMLSREPRHGLSHLGRAKALEALGQEPAARDSYALSCQLGIAAACGR